jgi:phosphate transport system substrate-binding protein
MTKQSSDSVSRRKFLVGAGTAGAIGLAGCTQSGGSGGGSDDGSGEGDGDGGLSGSIDIAGSSTVFPLATAMSERFKEEHPDVDFSLQSTGSGGGFANYFCTGDTDFNNASRPVQEEELATCEDNDVTPVELTVATDALTVIVNNEADWVDCLTVEELRQIWAAEDPPITWSDVNSDWPDEEFQLYGPTDASGTYDYFIEAIIGEEGPGHRQDYSATEQDRNIVQGVQGSEAAMGYLGFAYYTENSEAVKALGVDDGDGCVEPSLESARGGEYTPLSRPLFTYPAKEALAEEHIAEFARFWVENATSTEIVAEEVGYVPLSDEDQTAQMDALETAIEEAQN